MIVNTKAASTQSPTRVLVTGHSYVTSLAQNKIAAMQGQWSDASIFVLTPDRAPHIFNEFSAEFNPLLEAGRIIVRRRQGGRSNMNWYFRCRDVLEAFEKVRPKIMLVEEDPYSLAGLQFALLKMAVGADVLLGYFIWDNLNRRRPILRWLLKGIMQLFAATAAGYFVCGNRAACELLRVEKGYRGPILCIPQVGVSPSEFPVRKIGLNGVPRIGYVGRLVPEKGLRILCDAMEKISRDSWTATIVGSGPLGPELNEWVKRANFVGRIELRSAVPHCEVSAVLRSLDIFVLPSITVESWKEQFGLTLAQAMMSGCACIGTESGAIPEVLHGGGLTVREGDVNSLAEAIARLCRDEGLRHDYGRKARQVAIQHHSDGAVAAKYYRSLEAVNRSYTGSII